jgi:hypothetical protein
MKIHVEGNLYIESDERQFILKNYTGKKDAKDNELFKAIGYFGTLNQVAKKLIDMKIKESTATTLKELVADLERIEAEVNALIRA